MLLGGLVCAPPGAPVRAQERPGLKETLGKVQSDAESRAVENLIEKLKGGTPKAPPAPPSAAPAAPIRPAAQPPPPPRAADVQPPAAESRPDEAIRSADPGTAASIDLEIFFAYKSADITPKAAAQLAPLGRALSDPRLAGDRFLIAGHTDSKGGADYNLSLSQKRAEAVREFLIAEFGVDGHRLVARGTGSTSLKNPAQPLAAENRRVQIVNLSK